MRREASRPEFLIARFLNTDCLIQLRRYPDTGRIGLALVESRTLEPFAVATVNLPQVSLRPDEVLIKDYSENEGMLRALCEAKVLEPTGESVPSGYVAIPKCRLLVDVPPAFREGAILTRPAVSIPDLSPQKPPRRRL